MEFKDCKLCKQSKQIKDFLGKEICYSCLYEQKMKKIKRIPKCKQCKTPIAGKLHKRWVFCSQECAEKDKQESKYWTRSFLNDNKGYKRRFNPSQLGGAKTEY